MSRGGRLRRVEPTTTSSSGLWTLNEIADYISETKWPRGPVAPTSLLAETGNTQLVLSWTAPSTTHGTITNYLVEYTPSGGAAQYVLTNSTSTSYNLTGLTNGTSYTMRVAAVNFTAGDYSTAVTGNPTAAPPVTLHAVFGPVTGSGTVASKWAWQSGTSGATDGFFKLLTANASITLQATLNQTYGGNCDNGEALSLGIYSSSNVLVRAMSANPESLTAGQYIAMGIQCAHGRTEVWVV